MKSSRERRLLWGMVALLLLTYGFLASVLFTYRTWPFDSDEAVHAIEGLRLAADLRDGRIDDLISHLYFHRWYPPLLSLYSMPFLALLGPTYWAARLPLLLLWPLNLALLYRVGRTLWRRWEAGVVAAVLGATSPLLWVLALLSMEETLAMTGSLLVIAGYALATRDKLPWFWAGLALAVTFLARTSTGAFAGGALLVACYAQRGTLREKVRVLVQVLGPLAVTAFIWWAHPLKFQGLQDYFWASSPQSSITWPLLTHYVRQLFSTHTAGWGVGLLVVAAVLLSFFKWKQPVVRLLLSLFVITWGALVLKRQLAPRLFFPALLPAFLLAASQAGVVIDELEKRVIRGKRWVRGVLVGGLGTYVLIAVLIRVLSFPFLMEVVYETDPTLAESQAWIAQHVNDEKVFFVNGWDQFSAPALNWYLVDAHWPVWKGLDVVSVELDDPAERPEAVEDFRSAVLASPGAVIVHLENTPVPHTGAWWAYRAALTPCWDGEWEATTAFWTRIWDSRLEREVLAHPLRFFRQQDQESARQTLRYPLLFGVHVATCAGSSSQ